MIFQPAYCCSSGHKRRTHSGQGRTPRTPTHTQTGTRRFSSRAHLGIWGKPRLWRKPMQAREEGTNSTQTGEFIFSPIAMIMSNIKQAGIILRPAGPIFSNQERSEGGFCFHEKGKEQTQHSVCFAALMEAGEPWAVRAVPLSLRVVCF